MTTKKA